MYEDYVFQHNDGRVEASINMQKHFRGTWYLQRASGLEEYYKIYARTILKEKYPKRQFESRADEHSYYKVFLDRNERYPGGRQCICATGFYCEVHHMYVRRVIDRYVQMKLSSIRGNG